MKGECQFAEVRLFLRGAALIFRLLAKWAAVRGAREVDEEIELGPRRTPKALVSAGPRPVEPRPAEPLIFIFADGACRDKSTSVGGVIFVSGRGPEVSGATLN